jgi:hypothetical protein
MPRRIACGWLHRAGPRIKSGAVAKPSSPARASRRGPSGKELRARGKQPPKVGGDGVPDPLAPDLMRSMLTRIGLILLGIWLLAGLVFAVWPSGKYIPLAVAGVLTALAIGLLVWTLRRARSARNVATLLAGVETAEDRKLAIAKLESQGKSDPASVFARAQLEAQEDPRRALATLESLELGKLMGPVADEARGQRAMLHLGLGEVSLARQLVDNIDVKRASDPRSRAMLGAICAEAWARSGEPKRAIDTLDVFDQKDAALAQLLPQLLRAYAFSYAVTTRTKDLRRVLRRMIAIEPRLLGGFLTGKTHPLLSREAKRALEQSGAVPRRMQVQRMR